ncbi:hypothetical protein SBA4_640020 [Candidatus Sulfopaludibacter sp. SbA4]|nr:hypothetical protein SBA4_640020 [Candidatus Sulfopaludibacter sp. SbA4]
MSHETTPPFNAMSQSGPGPLGSGDRWAEKKPLHLSPKFGPSPQPKQTKCLTPAQNNARANAPKCVTTVTRAPTPLETRRIQWTATTNAIVITNCNITLGERIRRPRGPLTKQSVPAKPIAGATWTVSRAFLKEEDIDGNLPFDDGTGPLGLSQESIRGARRP